MAPLNCCLMCLKPLPETSDPGEECNTHDVKFCKCDNRKLEPISEAADSVTSMGRELTPAEIKQRLGEIYEWEDEGLYPVFSLDDLFNGVADAYEAEEDRLCPPSPMPPWPEYRSLGENEPFYSTRQVEAGLHKQPRVYAPWETKPDH